jgi:mono/diheme cytochrome c family protein
LPLGISYMPRSLLSYLLWAALLPLLIAGGIVAYIYSGIYDISATEQHTSPVYWAVSTARRQSIRNHSAEETPPFDLSGPDAVAEGLGLFDRHCLQCHGAPGIAPHAIGLGMMPSPPNFAQMGRDLSPAETYWAITNGIKLTGMPAWKHRLTERERWAVTAFVKRSPAITPAEYRELTAHLAGAPSDENPSRGSEAPWQPEGAVERGRGAIQQYACATCHVIPGIRGPEAQVGPNLDGIASRIYLAGVLQNTPDDMTRWLRHPQRIKPLSAMPELGVTERDARDIAAYLYTLR